MNMTNAYILDAGCAPAQVSLPLQRGNGAFHVDVDSGTLLQALANLHAWAHKEASGLAGVEYVTLVQTCA